MAEIKPEDKKKAEKIFDDARREKANVEKDRALKGIVAYANAVKSLGGKGAVYDTEGMDRQALVQAVFDEQAAAAVGYLTGTQGPAKGPAWAKYAAVSQVFNQDPVRLREQIIEAPELDVTTLVQQGIGRWNQAGERDGGYVVASAADSLFSADKKNPGLAAAVGYDATKASQVEFAQARIGQLEKEVAEANSELQKRRQDNRLAAVA